MLLTCRATVFSLMKSSAAIVRLVFPAATSTSTSRSRRLSPVRARAGTADTRRRPDLQDKRDRKCPRVYAVTASDLNGKEGVDGSSPSEGLQIPAHGDFRSGGLALDPACLGYGAV